jgi:hypothetical protein
LEVRGVAAVIFHGIAFRTDSRKVVDGSSDPKPGDRVAGSNGAATIDRLSPENFRQTEISLLCIAGDA